MNRIDLSVIIVNYNTPVLLETCVKSVLENTKNIIFEIIIIDNASDIESNEVLRSLNKLKSVTVVKSKKNLGFAGGNNIGIKIAKGEFVLLLNSDTIIQSNVLSDMVEFMKQKKNIGISSCALKNQDGSLQMPGGFAPNLINITSWMLFLDDLPVIKSLIRPYHWRPSNKITHLDWVPGTFFLIRREVISQIGNLDESYFMYVEDMDYCMRAKKAGWKIAYNPSFSIIHLGGASSNKEFWVIGEFKALKLYFKKYKNLVQQFILRILLKTGSLIRVPVLGILRGREVAKIYEKAFRVL